MVILILIRFLTYLIVWLSIGIVVAAGLAGSFYLWSGHVTFTVSLGIRNTK